MLKHVETRVVFAEVPDEVTLAINIAGCPCHCEGCHSAWLADDIGTPLDDTRLLELADRARGITCVAIMGGDADPREAARLADVLKHERPALRTAWYSGRAELPAGLDISPWDYVKLGPWQADRGPLSSPDTNQRMWRVIDGRLADDITHRFQK